MSITIINTNQNSKKIGRLTPPTSSKKDDYTGNIAKTESGYPLISIKKEINKFILRKMYESNNELACPLKASSRSSALAQLKKIALVEYKKVNNLHVSHSNIPVYYETTN